MSLFTHPWVQQREEAERQRIRGIISASRARRRARATQSDHFRQLEDELGRVSLLAFALADLCLAKGLVTEEELDERLRAIDAEDGVEDEKPAKGRALPGRKRPSRD